MMQRRYVLISWLFAMTVIAVYDACHAQVGEIGTLLGMATRCSIIGLGVVSFLGASLCLQKWMARGVKETTPQRECPSPQTRLEDT